VGIHFGTHWAHSLALSPTCESLLLTNLFSWSHVFLHSTLNHEPNVRVTTNKVFWTKYLLKWNTTFVSSYFCMSCLLKCFHHWEITIIINCNGLILICNNNYNVCLTTIRNIVVCSHSICDYIQLLSFITMFYHLQYSPYF
jgi:hypothetical protein